MNFLSNLRIQAYGLFGVHCSVFVLNKWSNCCCYFKIMVTIYLKYYKCFVMLTFRFIYDTYLIGSSNIQPWIVCQYRERVREEKRMETPWLHFWKALHSDVCRN